MKIELFVKENVSDKKVLLNINPMTTDDAENTRVPIAWQTDWTSKYISKPSHYNYSFKTSNGELIALASYELLDEAIAVYIVYGESSPESNPTMTKNKKYIGIGKAIIAFGILLSINKGFGGTVFFEAKTTELAKHYLEDFHALPLPTAGQAGPQRFMIDGDIAKELIEEYIIK